VHGAEGSSRVASLRLLARDLRQDNDLALHAQVVVKSANVRVCAWMRKGYPESCYAEWRLG